MCVERERERERVDRKEAEVVLMCCVRVICVVCLMRVVCHMSREGGARSSQTALEGNKRDGTTRRKAIFSAAHFSVASFRATSF